MMPVRTARLHLDPYWLGDSPRAIAKAKLYTDTNLQACKDDDIALHWGIPSKGGWKFIWTGKLNRFGREVRRPMTHHELSRPIGKWASADVQKWRLTLRQGVTYKSKLRPHTFSQMQAVARAHGKIICWELKNRAYGGPRGAALVVKAEASHHVAYFMALIQMTGCQQKCAQIINAGGEFAVLTHGAPKPRNFDTWSPKPTRLWPDRPDWRR